MSFNSLSSTLKMGKKRLAEGKCSGLKIYFSITFSEVSYCYRSWGREGSPEDKFHLVAGVMNLRHFIL